MPGLTEEDWLDYARRGYRENAAGVPVPDIDPKIAEAFRNPATAPRRSVAGVFANQGRADAGDTRGAIGSLSAATVARMAREKPDLEHITVANRGHAPLLNEPACLAAIDAFVARYGRISGS